MNENLINPIIKLGYGQCRVCTGPIRILESEITDFTVNSKGDPIQATNEALRIVGYCVKCNSTVPMMRSGMSFVPDAKVLRVLGTTPFEVKKNNINLKDNPFCKGDK